MKFCIKCGKKTDKLKEHLCSSCHEDEFELKIKDIRIEICVACAKYLYKNKWSKFKSIEKTLKEILSEQIKEKAKIQVIIPKHKINEGINIKVECIITIKDHEFLVPAKVEYTLCPKCGKIGSTYFEGILQLRNPNPEIIIFIKNQIRKQFNKGTFINKEVEVKNGIDFYITNKRFLRTLGNRLNKQFKGKLNVSPQLFSHNKQSSKDIYRINILFRVDEEKKDND